MQLERVGQGSHDGREWLVGGAADLASLSAGFACPGPHCVLFLALDATGAVYAELLKAATILIARGVAYVCAWGPGARRVEQAFDEAATNLAAADACSFGPDDVIMTVSDEATSLEEALWFAAWSSYPTPQFQSTTRSLVALAVGQAAWEERIRQYLALGAPMTDEA